MSDSSLGGTARRLYAKTGGVIGVNGLGEFLDHREATSRSMFRHIDYMVRLVDPQHVGIGLDFSKRTDAFWASVLNSSQLWPPNPNHKRTATKLAQPDRLVELSTSSSRPGTPRRRSAAFSEATSGASPGRSGNKAGPGRPQRRHNALRPEPAHLNG